MDHILKKYSPRIDFESYEDFKENFTIDVPGEFNFGFDVVDEWAKVEPDKKALHWVSDEGEEFIFTFKDISQLSNKFANAITKLGLVQGDVVMMILRRRWEYWVCATAFCKLGITIIPATLQLTSKDIAYRVNNCKVKAIIAVDDAYVVEQVNKACEDCGLQYRILVDDTSAVNKDLLGDCLVNADVASSDEWLTFTSLVQAQNATLNLPDNYHRPKSTDIMLMYFTSGTTGEPKAVCHNFAHPLGHILTAKYWQRVQENELHMSVTDSGWAKFGWGKIYGQWICGACIFAYDFKKFTGQKLLQIINDYDLRTFCAPPTMYRFMLQEDVSAYDLSSVANFATAGEPLNPEIVTQWKKFSGKVIKQGFGQTEGPVLIAHFEWLDDRENSFGKPSPLFNIQLLDEDEQNVEEGDEGRICVCDLENYFPPGLFVAYNIGGHLNRDVFSRGYYNLYDMAWMDSDGYMYFVGRDDDVIKCSGYRIGPFEVESALLEHPAVVESAVTAAPDPIRGNVVKATIVLAAGYAPSDELIKELQDHTKKTTAPYKYPRIIEFVDELPKTVGGKIKRKQIRQKDGIKE